MKAIYTAQSLLEAGILQNVLLAHGIDADIENSSAPIPPAAPPTILVEDANAETALKLIREHLSQKGP